MIRKLLLLVAVLLAVPAFAADVSVTPYGKLDLGYSHIWSAGPFNKDATDLVESGQLSGSRVGIKVLAPLTQGFSAVGQAEAGFSADRSDFAIINRQAFAGLSNPKFGKLTLGRHATPQYFLMSDVDPFEIGTVGDMSTLVKRVSRTSNSIQYVTPKLLGLELTGLYSQAKADLETYRNDEDVPGWMVAARWSAGPVLLGASYYQDYERGKILVEDDEPQHQYSGAWSRVANAGGTLDLKYVKLAGYGSLYEKGPTPGVVKTEQVAFMAGAFVPAGPGSFRLSFTHLHDLKTTFNDKGAVISGDASKYSAGYFFNWTKAADLYLVYAHIQNFGHAKYVFDATKSTEVASGNNGLSTGLRLAF